MQNQEPDIQTLLNNTLFNNDFSEEVYNQTYRYGEENINQTHYRVSADLASIEKDPGYWTEQFNYALEDFKFVPGGRITSNAGTGLEGTTYINCFVDGFMGEDQDSMEGILDTLRRQALILKSEGGYGFCADVMRPRGSFIQGIGNSTPGAVRMLDMWDTQSAVITAGSGLKKTHKKQKEKIRKGAQMVTMSVWHPDIKEFITSKQTSGRLQKFNMSILVSNKFMEAVQNSEPWVLEFPDHEKAKSEYKKEWDGNIENWKDKGYPTQVYHTYKDANELWDIIMESTYNRNEPGILFVDTMNNLNNLHYCEHINATNPCGEQVLPIGGVCLLGSLNLTQFIDFEKRDWDYKKLKKIIPIAIRFMDNVNDKTNVPLKIQEKSLVDKRRIGLGYLGYGSALMMMRIKYGSKRALELTEKLGDFVMNVAYQSSAHIAQEKGSFGLYNEEEYFKGEFVKNLSSITKKLIKKCGIRNSHLLSIQPTGNSSVFANNVSGGLEPVFLPEYTRTAIQSFPPDMMNIPVSINWNDQKFKMQGNHTAWNWKKEGDESLLYTKHDGSIWKIDQNRGLLKESTVKDYAVRYLESVDKWDASASWVATTSTLTIDDHIKTMAVFSKYVDAAMSKTVNLPNSYPYEDFKKLYLKLYKTGTVKGATTYRAGTMATVLSEKETIDTENPKKIIKTEAPRRPKSLPCDIHNITVKGKKWIILVGIMEGDPYEVFAFKEKKLKLSASFKAGTLTKISRGQYQLECDGGFLLTDIKDFFENDEQEALTRIISTALRHGAKLKFVVEQLNKAEGSIVSFGKAIARTLKKYLTSDEINTKCSTCGDPSGMLLIEGCEKCKNCGASTCS